MKRFVFYRSVFSFMIIAALVVTGFNSAAQKKITGLMCEYKEFPLGIDVLKPRFSWQLALPGAATQAAYRVLVASDKKLLLAGRPDVWDSQKQAGDSQLVYFGGSPLKAHTRYWWQVEVWTGHKSLKSDPVWFETAKMYASDWEANWITDEHGIEYEASPRFRKIFNAKNKIASARCYISGLGYYQLYINGHCINPVSLDPGFTDYSKRILYNTYDITERLKGGINCIGIQLGNGWFNEQTPTVWNFHKAPWRKRPQTISEVHIIYKDGTSEVIKTGPDWLTATGPLRFDNIHAGTTYDATQEQEGWATAAFNASGWQTARVTQATAPIIEAQAMPGIGVSEILQSKKVKKINDTCYVFDMGINFAGVPRLSISGAKGTTITLRHAEMTDSLGRADQRNINMHLRPRNDRDVIQTDIYRLRGTGTEIFVPAFTYHGFRYIEMTSDRPIDIQKVKMEALRMHSKVEEAGSFNSSDKLLNNIFAICSNSYLSNLFGIPTDCPTREKNGWMADGFMVQEAGMLSYNAGSVYAKWVKDMTDAQDANGNVPGIVPTSWQWDSEWAGPVWDAAIFIVPSLLYQYYGDVESMRNVYPTAQRYLEYLATIENNKGLLKDGLGDWLYYKAITPNDFMVSCYYYWDNILMSRMAKVLGKPGDEKRYAAKANDLKEKINKYYFNGQQLLYANQTQLSYALPLYMNLAPSEHRNVLAKKLNEAIAANNYSLDFGFIGSLIVPEVLSQFGYTETVYKMVTKETMPSWGYWIKNYDATSLFETWDVGRNIGDASRNHPSMGAIAAWMYKALAGIQMDGSTPAFKKIIIKPAFIKDLNFVEAHHQSVYGTIRSAWKREGHKILLNITIPATCTATVFLPGKPAQEVQGGSYSFSFEN